MNFIATPKGTQFVNFVKICSHDVHLGFVTLACLLYYLLFNFSREKPIRYDCCSEYKNRQLLCLQQIYTCKSLLFSSGKITSTLLT